jgi:hypothetical protein
LRGYGVWIPIKEVVKGARIMSRFWIVKGLSLCVEGSRALAWFGELKEE